MAITRLKRKARRNKQRSADRVNKIKQLTQTPVLVNVDKEELKASFATAATEEAPKAKKAKAVKEEAPEAEAKPAKT
jgi:CRISPR/Cas system Type II protein with McrA/HNH and RuvC-like nuclease domain